jgi:hypothetical protein
LIWKRRARKLHGFEDRELAAMGDEGTDLVFEVMDYV